jgi:hypothetical protein
MKRGIYMLEGGGYQKIGMTSNLDGRLGAIRLSVPFELVVVAFYPVALQDHLRPLEQRVHNKFTAFRVRPRSEWFKLPEEERQACITMINNLTPVVYGGRVRKPVNEARAKWAEESLERLRNYQHTHRTEHRIFESTK